MIKCRVCGKEVSLSLRKHAVGKWLNAPEDNEHLKLAIELTPGASAFVGETNLGEGNDRHELPIVRGTIHRED